MRAQIDVPRTGTTPVRALARAAHLTRPERRRLAASLALALGAVLAATALLAISGYLISRASQRPEILALTAVITAIRALSLARALLRYGERLVSHDLALRVLARLRARFFAVLAPLSSDQLGGQRRGELLSRFVGDVDALEDLYLRALAPPVVALAVILATSAGVYFMLADAGVVLLVCLLSAATVLPLITGAIAAAAGRRQATARAALSAELVESLAGATELAVARRGAERLARVDKLSRHLIRLGHRDAMAGAAMTGLSTLLSGLTMVLMLIVAIPAVDHHQLSPVLLAALVLAALGAFEAITPLGGAARTLRGAAEAARRLADVETVTPAVSEPEHPVALTRQHPTGTAPSLEHVSFRYADTDPWLLRDVDLGLTPGCRIAVTGPSGSGKSTLAKLLVRFLDPTAGTARLADRDMRTLALADVRANAVLIAQDAHIFATSIRENLRLANRTAATADLERALADVGLGDWVATLPAGLDTTLGENGALMSGGQRQRLAVARALVSDAPFIILDEPTAHLDPDGARRLLTAVDRAAAGRGLLLITHRDEALEHFSPIHELRDGRLSVPADHPLPILT